MVNYGFFQGKLFISFNHSKLMEKEGKNDLKRAGAIISILFSITLLGIITFSQKSNDGITGAAVSSTNGLSSQPLLIIGISLIFLILGAIILFKLNR